MTVRRTARLLSSLVVAGLVAAGTGWTVPASAWDSVPGISSHVAITTAAVDHILKDSSQPTDFRAWVSAHRDDLIDFTAKWSDAPFIGALYGELVHTVKRPAGAVNANDCGLDKWVVSGMEPYEGLASYTTGAAQWAVGNNPGDTHPEYWWQTAVCLQRAGETKAAVSVLGQLIHSIVDQGALPHAYYKMHGGLGADQNFEYNAALSDYDITEYLNPSWGLYPGKNLLDIAGHEDSAFASFDVSKAYQFGFDRVALAPRSAADPLPLNLQTPGINHLRLDFSVPPLQHPLSANPYVQVAVYYERADGSMGYREAAQRFPSYPGWWHWDIYDSFAPNGRLWLSERRLENGTEPYTAWVQAYGVGMNPLTWDVTKPALHQPWEYYDWMRNWTLWNTAAPYWHRYYAGLDTPGDLAFSFVAVPQAEKAMLSMQWYASQLVTEWVLRDAFEAFKNPPTVAAAGGQGYRVALYDQANFNSRGGGSPEEKISYAVGCEPYANSTCGTFMAAARGQQYPIIGDGVFTAAGIGAKVTMKAGDLGIRGMLRNNLSSIEIRNAQVTLYTGKYFTGDHVTFNHDVADLSQYGLNDRVQSVKIVPAGVTAVPTAQDDYTTTTAGVTVTIPVTNNDVPGAAGGYTVRLSTAPTRGTATVVRNAIVYTPVDDYTGPWPGNETFSYEITNAAGVADSANVSVQVTTARNDQDHDGVTDASDNCPTAPGAPGRNGCPQQRAAMFTDFNADRKADVFWANPLDGRWYVSDSGTGLWHAINTSGVPAEQLLLHDLNGDGKADVFWANPADGKWYVSWGGTSSWQLLNSAGVPAEQLQLADFNGDGKADVFWANPADGKWYVSYGATGLWQAVNSSGASFASLRLGDLNGDGRTDVLWVNGDRMRWYVSYGATGTWQALNTALTGSDRLQLADLNGDRKADVFFASQDEKNRWYVSYGGITPWEVLGGARAAYYQLQVADLTGDGKADVFWPSVDGAWYLSTGGTTAWQAINAAGVPEHELIVGGVQPRPARAPTAVTAPAVVGGAGSAVVSWLPPTNEGGSPVTRYSVSVSPGGKVVTTTGSARSATVTGLAGGVTYAFAVRAANVAGTSPVATTSAAGTAVGLSAPAAITAGRSAGISGSLRTSAGVPLAGRTVRILAKPSGATAFVTTATVVSNAAGGFAATVRPTRSTQYAAAYAGGPALMGASSPVRSIAVRRYLTLRSSKPTVRHGSPAFLSGVATPAQYRLAVSLQRYTGRTWVSVATTTLAASGAFRATWRPAVAGTYRLRAVVPASRGNAAGVSATVVLRVS